jgi:prepilin-type N-terminal cleavage/methylation domain-containing protein
MRKTAQPSTHYESGFTLIEMLLVMVIMGIMLAVIVPRAWRANVDAKYTLCRQNCTELAKYTQEWCENMLQAQAEDDTATLKDYYQSLKRNQAGVYAAPVALGGNYTDNWNDNKGQLKVNNRTEIPETCVEALAPPDKKIRNPFNGSGIFDTPNDFYTARHAISGAIAFTGGADGSYTYYALLFQGTDNETYSLSANSSFHAGMGPNGLGAIRNGIFVARVR